MRNVFGLVAGATRRGVARASHAQGVGGVAAVGAGTYLNFGLGWCLLAVGTFLLIGAWGSR